MVLGAQGRVGWQERKPRDWGGCVLAVSTRLVWGGGWGPKRLKRCLSLLVQGKAGKRRSGILSKPDALAVKLD